MLVIGLTGGIGSGKSTVAKLFAELGIEIIDADEFARIVVQPHTAGLAEIVKHFGKEILTAQGELNRQELRQKIFKHPEERVWLEQLLHPLIRQAMRERLAQVKSSYCIMVIPLLIESKPNELIDRILVVDAPEELQIERAMERDHLDRAQCEAIMKVQATREQRLSRADDVIDNSKDLNYLKQQVKQLNERYRLLI